MSTAIKILSRHLMNGEITFRAEREPDDTLSFRDQYRHLNFFKRQGIIHNTLCITYLIVKTLQFFFIQRDDGRGIVIQYFHLIADGIPQQAQSILRESVINILMNLVVRY